jgi:hypothetical protein
VGCNLALNRVPAEARITIVITRSSGRESAPSSSGESRESQSRLTSAATIIVPPEEVRAQYKRVKPLKNISVTQRGWTLDVLNIVRRLVNSEGRAPRDPNSWKMGRRGTPPSDIFTNAMSGGRRDRSAAGCSTDRVHCPHSKNALQRFSDRLDATGAGLVLEIVLLEVALAFGRVQVAAIQQGAADARAVLGFKLPQEFPHFPVRFIRARPVLPLAAAMLESNRDDAAGDGSARALFSRHAGPEPAGQSEGRILVEMEIIAERVQNGLRAVVPGEKLFHGNIASGFHRFPLAERNKNEPESPDGQAR